MILTRNLTGELLSNWHWLAFYGMILLTWSGLLGLIIPLSEWHNLWIYGGDLLFAICSVNPSDANIITLIFMWLLMSAAMMLPTLVPTLLCYDDLRSTGAGSRKGFWGLTIGYLAIWFGFALLAALMQRAWNYQMVFENILLINTHYLSALLFLVAGLYQFSNFKEACLSKCRNPLTMILTHWKANKFCEIKIGIRLGLVCLGCCFLLMSFAWIGGAMSLLWMGLATLVMTVEKFPKLGPYISKPLGYLLIGLAMLMIFQVWQI